MGKRQPYYYKKIDKVSSVEKHEEQGMVYYVVEFEEGISIGMSEMRYKQSLEPKKGDSYTIIYSNRGNALLKNYPERIKSKEPSLRIRPHREYKSTRGVPT